MIKVKFKKPYKNKCDTNKHITYFPVPFFPERKQHFQDLARVHYYRVPFFPVRLIPGAIFS